MASSPDAHDQNPAHPQQPRPKAHYRSRPTCRSQHRENRFYSHNRADPEPAPDRSHQAPWDSQPSARHRRNAIDRFHPVARWSAPLPRQRPAEPPQAIHRRSDRKIRRQTPARPDRRLRCSKSSACRFRAPGPRSAYGANHPCRLQTVTRSAQGRFQPPHRPDGQRRSVSRHLHRSAHPA